MNQASKDVIMVAIDHGAILEALHAIGKEAGTFDLVDVGAMKMAGFIEEADAIADRYLGRTFNLKGISLAPAGRAKGLS